MADRRLEPDVTQVVDTICYSISKESEANVHNSQTHVVITV